MPANSRLAIAIHALGILALKDGTPVTSECLAMSIGTNPVVVRRIVGRLAKAGLVTVQMGAGGGSRLARLPKRITLADIYAALDEGAVFDVPLLKDSHACKYGITVRPVLREVFADAESGLTKKLRNVSLSDVIKLVKERLPKSSL